MPRNWSPSPYWPGPVLKKRRRAAAVGSSAMLLNRASASRAVIRFVPPSSLPASADADGHGPQPSVVAKPTAIAEQRGPGGVFHRPQELLTPPVRHGVQHTAGE